MTSLLRQRAPIATLGLGLLLIVGCSDKAAPADGGAAGAPAGGRSGGGGAGATGGGGATGAAGGGGAGRGGGGWGGAAGAGGAAGLGGAGGAAVSYSGCNFIGGVDRISVAKRDPARSLCAVIVFADGTSANPSGVTLPQNWKVEFAFTTTSVGACELRAPPTGAARSTSQTGTASWKTGTAAPFTTADVDVVLHFTGDGGAIPDEAIRATGVDVSHACQ